VKYEKKKLFATAMKRVAKPFEEVEVVDGSAAEDAASIGIHEPIIAYANRRYARKGGAIELNAHEDVSGSDGQPVYSLKDNQGLEITFHRTIRMPDDDRLHQLPASLGIFPLFDVRTHTERLPRTIVQQGGVFLPMWQREALWMEFSSSGGRKYALRVFVGRVNAVSGAQMDTGDDTDGNLNRTQDYVIVPGQEWLDGICVAPGVVRQFVAMPCT
jgi:hypothetical protein